MQETTFWELITSSNIKKICIPTIQRDYAQGRRDEVYVRNNFLKSLKTAICKKIRLSLDFVYGVDSETMFVPLDGQQRLTTLWLLHWYIAYRAGVLVNDDIRSYFMKFSYETRLSSTDFCKSICGLAPNINKESLRNWITKQTWFYHQYRQDPTIMGMLNMIAGTDIKDKNGEDIVDGLEELFNDEEYDYLELWKSLTECEYVIFNKLKVGSCDSDNLYVKMNARGRQLTDFENFKTELVQYVKDENILDEKESLDFSAKLDVQWTDIFWKYRWEDEKTKDVSIDEIYFAFIRRYALLECVRKNGDNTPLKKMFTAEFTSFDPYKKVLDKQSITDLIKIMDNLRGHDLETKSSWGEKFDFIPVYREGKFVLDITDLQPLLFYGYCRYFCFGEYNDSSFSEWNRVLWNICENRVDKSNLVPTITEIDLLASHSHDIIGYLSQDYDIESEHNKVQLKEEQCKARHISSYPMIREMEGYAFFHGAIRFLYTNNDNKEDWNDFETKANNIKFLIPLKKENRHTIKLLTPYITEQALKSIYCYWTSNADARLRNLLLLENSVPYIHNFLLQNDEKPAFTPLHRDIIDLCEEAYEGEGCLRSNWTEHSTYIWTEYASRSGSYEWLSFVVGDEPYKSISFIIEHSSIFELYEEHLNNKVGNHFAGLYLHFKYKGNELTLYGNNTICLMTDHWNRKIENPSDQQGYYFSIETIETQDQLIDQINKIVAAHNNRNNS